MVRLAYRRSDPFRVPVRRASGPPPCTRASGFTLIEMMVVVGIIAILALMMVPTYHDKVVRDQVATAIKLADIAKPRIEAVWSFARALPPDNRALDLPPAHRIVSNHVRALSVHDGAIHIVFGNSANALVRDRTLSIRPAIVEDAPVVPIAWVCGYGPVPGGMTAKGENRTSVEARYLPVSCRGG